MMTTLPIGEFNALKFLFCIRILPITMYSGYLRLNYRYTVALLCALAVIVTNRQFSEAVIRCWVPAFFTPK